LGTVCTVSFGVSNSAPANLSKKSPTFMQSILVVNPVAQLNF
jgi:hypothetical protein